MDGQVDGHKEFLIRVTLFRDVNSWTQTLSCRKMFISVGTRCADQEVYHQCGTRHTDKGEEGQETKQST